MLPAADFSVSVDPKLAQVELPRMPLQQILLNLISNAIKHHHRDSGHIQVTVKDQGEYYAFAVTDDGPGIAERFHAQIFNAFQTLKPRDQVEGSGMGLAFVRKYVETYGGTVTLQSKEGEGSTFGFTFPKHHTVKEMPHDYAMHI